LFDLTIDQSLQAGVADLEAAMAKYGNDHLVIYGYSQGSGVANLEKRKLTAQYPEGTKAPDIDFVLGGDPNLPNGGVASRFAGFSIPILGWTFNGPAPTDTQFDTTVIVRQYDIEDFPLYPLNIFADLNALLGAVYVHFYGFDVSLAPNPSTTPSIRSRHGDTTYYFFPTADLPLFGPLRTLGVPEAVIDVVEPFFRVLVELGYDRSIPLWKPTPARLFPKLDPVKVAADLVNAIGEGVNNALALTGTPVPISAPAPAMTADADSAVEQVDSVSEATVERVSNDEGERVSQVLTAVGSPLPEPPAVTEDDPYARQGKVEHQLPAIMHQIVATSGVMESSIGNGRATVKSTGGDNGSPTSPATPARKMPVRDTLKDANSHVKEVATKVSDSIKNAFSRSKDDDKKRGDEDAARGPRLTNTPGER
jgi:hypothetical protein